MAGDHPSDESVIRPFLDAHPHKLFFLTGSGAHLYGFPSPDSDYDLRGAHTSDPALSLSLDPPRETYDVLDRDAPVEMDLVTHDVRKYFKMLLSKNGYVLEQICSPLVVVASDGFDELRELAPKVVTRFHHYHFERFAQNQWDMVSGPSRGTVKGMLYTYRPLMAGIVLMTERVVESNIVRLNERFGFGFIDELVDAKVTGAERQTLPESDMEFHREQFGKLRERLVAESERSGLPDAPGAEVRRALSDLAVRVQLSA